MKKCLVEYSPVLQEISFEESRMFSPWPNRILGMEKWQKKTRKQADILKEYNEGWYQDALNYYAENKDLYGNRLNAGGAVAVLKDFENLNTKKMEQMADVYGKSSMSRNLSSFGDKLFVGDLYVLRYLFRHYVIETIRDYIGNTKAIIEAGCGTGINLFCLFSSLNMEFVKGGEVCPNAVKLSSQLANDFNVNGEFIPFDFYNQDDIKELCDHGGDYVLLTAQAIEQLPSLPDFFVDTIRSLKNPPKLVLHFEPVQFPVENVFDQYCHTYSKLNLYNQDLFYKLLAAHNADKIKLLKIRKHVFGISAFNPTSFMVWSPK